MSPGSSAVLWSCGGFIVGGAAGGVLGAQHRADPDTGIMLVGAFGALILSMVGAGYGASRACPAPKSVGTSGSPMHLGSVGGFP